SRARGAPPVLWENAISPFRSPRPARPIRRGARPMLEALEDRATPALLWVNTLADTLDPTDNQLSLREAVAAVNSNSLSLLSPTEQTQVQGTPGQNDTIAFQLPSGSTIALTQQRTVGRDVTIRGPGVTVSGQGSTRDFLVEAGVTATLRDLGICGGSSDSGGGVYNAGTLTLDTCNLSGNSATYKGGGVC